MYFARCLVFMQQLTCKNCGNTFEKNFCNNCGQKEAHRITVGHLLHDVVHVFTHADKGIFSFIARVVTHPGVMAKEYVEGKRKIFNPFQYLILILGFTTFLLAQSSLYEGMMQEYSGKWSNLPAYYRGGMIGTLSYVEKYSNIISFLSLPIYALFSWLLFKKRPTNYAEHFTIQLFAQSQASTINVLIILAFIIGGSLSFESMYITFMLLIVSFTVAYRQFFSISWLKSLWKSLLILVLSYFVQMFLMLIAMFGYIIYLKNHQ